MRGHSTESNVLRHFSAPVRAWFEDCHGTPTEPQREAWPRIKNGENVLIHSPTGSGTTLEAFLSALDALYSVAESSEERGFHLQ